MDALELEIMCKDRSRDLLMEVNEIETIKVLNPQPGVIKKLMLGLGDVLIEAGIRLHSIYQPPIEKTLRDHTAVIDRMRIQTGTVHLESCSRCPE